MSRYEYNNQDNWPQAKIDVIESNSEFIKSVLSVCPEDINDKIDALIDHLIRWKELSIQLLDTLLIANKIITEADMTEKFTEFYVQGFLFVLSNAENNIKQSGIDHYLLNKKQSENGN